MWKLSRNSFDTFTLNMFLSKRFCGKKFCAGRGYCESTGDHSIIYCRWSGSQWIHAVMCLHIFLARKVPFELQVNFDPSGGFPQAQYNKGFKLNYFQIPCWDCNDNNNVMLFCIVIGFDSMLYCCMEKWHGSILFLFCYWQIKSQFGRRLFEHMVFKVPSRKETSQDQTDDFCSVFLLSTYCEAQARVRQGKARKGKERQEWRKVKGLKG